MSRQTNPEIDEIPSSLQASPPPLSLDFPIHKGSANAEEQPLKGRFDERYAFPVERLPPISGESGKRVLGRFNRAPEHSAHDLFPGLPRVHARPILL